MLLFFFAVVCTVDVLFTMFIQKRFLSRYKIRDKQDKTCKPLVATTIAAAHVMSYFPFNYIISYYFVFVKRFIKNYEINSAVMRYLLSPAMIPALLYSMSSMSTVL